MQNSSLLHWGLWGRGEGRGGGCGGDTTFSRGLSTPHKTSNFSLKNTFGTFVFYPIPGFLGEGSMFGTRGAGFERRKYSLRKKNRKYSIFSLRKYSYLSHLCQPNQYFLLLSPIFSTFFKIFFMFSQHFLRNSEVIFSHSLGVLNIFSKI